MWDFFTGDLGILQFAYLQVGCILVTLIRNLEFQLEKIPASDYSVSFPSLQRGIASQIMRQQSLFVCPQGPCTVRYRRRFASKSQ